MKFAENYIIPEHIVKSVMEISKESQSIADIPVEKMASVHKTFKVFLDGTHAFKTLEKKDGIIAFDFQPPEKSSLTEQIMLSTAMFHLVNSAIYTPVTEPKNRTSYTMFKCSADNPEQMKEAGVRFYMPDEKLGYHNDVFFQNGQYSIPKYVSLINLFIGYDAPGNFYYINQNIWKKFDEVFSKAAGKRFKFRPTPVVYESHLEQELAKSPMDEWTDVPVCWESEAGQKYVFSNGELKDNHGTTTVTELKESLLNNPEKIAIPQKINRIMVFRNDLGFHSRDIFKEQKEFEGTTRLFLRSVSGQSVAVPQI